MSLDFTFTVPLAPIGKGRPRLSGGRIHTPPKTSRWERDFAFVAAAFLPKGITGPVRVDIWAVLPRPQSLCRRTDPDGPVWAPARPDVDNITKAVLDALQAHWTDDAQVVCGEPVKTYAPKGESPRVVVRVSTPPADPMEVIRRLGLEVRG